MSGHLFPWVKDVGMATKRTKADRSQRQTEQLEKKVDRHPDEIEKKPSTLAPAVLKSGWWVGGACRRWTLASGL